MPFPLPPWIPLSLLALAVGAWVLTRIRLGQLDDLPPAEASDATVLVCIPARDEAEEIGPALDGWLAQDLPGLRVLVVDDGSRDSTPALLAARAGNPRLTVLRNDHLPPGWLGKNHALHLASSHPWAREAGWLLFADADVRADPDLARRALAYLRTRPADALALLPALDTVSLAERIFLPTLSITLLWAFSPVRVADPRSRVHCGVGAFTLVRREVYDRIGGHAAAPMEAVDDMQLAARVKAGGGINRLALGGPALRIRMYHGFWELFRGLRKNALGYRWLVPLAPVTVAVLLGLFLSPALLAAGGWPLSGLLLWLSLPPVVAEIHQRYSGKPVDLAWAFWPVIGPVLAAGVVWALLDALRGINHWRGRDVPVR